MLKYFLVPFNFSIDVIIGILDIPGKKVLVKLERQWIAAL
jgi:hypothetical protein